MVMHTIAVESRPHRWNLPLERSLHVERRPFGGCRFSSTAFAAWRGRCVPSIILLAQRDLGALSPAQSRKVEVAGD